MSLPVGFRIEAEREYIDARSFYEDKQPGLGLDFDKALNVLLRRVSERPEICQIAFSDIRRVVCRIFPTSSTNACIRT